MGLEKEVMHVVIKLPFKRPADFVEPPPVVWTDDMEHQLWKHLNQKHTDWNYIAEQLGVPTPYLVRHAAFMYETQLRGIQQQLRLSEAGRPTTISSSPPPVVSTSSSSSNTYRASRPSSQRQVRPVSSSSTSSRTQQQQRNSTVWKDALEQPTDESATTMATPATPLVQPVATTSVAVTSSTNSTSMRTSPISRQGNDRHSTTMQLSITSSSMDIEATAMATAPLDRYQHSTHDDSMMLSTISNISPRNKYSSSSNNINDADLAPLSPHDDHSNYTNSQQQNAPYQSPGTPMTSRINDRGIQKEVDHGSGNLETKYYETTDSQHEMEMNGGQGTYRDDMQSTGTDCDSLNNSSNNNNSSSNNDDDNDDGFSKHFENMKLQLEEPAFLPSRRMEGSQILSSLRASSYQNRSALSSPVLGTPRSSSTNSPSTPSSQPYSSAAATSPLAPSSSSQQQQPSELENASTVSEQNRVQDDSTGIGGQTLSEDYSNENKATNSNNDDASDTSSNGKAKMIFGPSLSRAATTQQSDESSNKDANSALNSVGSSFSDLSDYSVTQSAMEDAFLSKLNNGSKMSSLAFSRKYT